MNKLDVIDVCPLCGNKDVQHLMNSTWSKNDRHLLEMLEMDYVPASWAHCSACNHVFLNPSFSVSIENKLYGEDSIYRKFSVAGKSDDEYLKEIDPTVRDKSMIHGGHLKRLKEIKKIVNLERLICVDFGAGFGPAESAILSLGWDYFGSEKDAWCLSKAKELGRSVKPDLPDAIGVGGADLVYSSQVFEHIKKPNEVAQVIRSILKPGGYVFIDVPTHTYDLRVMSSIGPGGLKCMNWGHYHSYTPESLASMLSNWGFVVVKVWLAGGDVNVLAKKMEAVDLSVQSEARRSYSIATARLKIQMLRWIFIPLKLLFIDFPVNLLRQLVPNFLKEYVRSARLRIH
jgi:SAM-dependent methyltransferase